MGQTKKIQKNVLTDMIRRTDQEARLTDPRPCPPLGSVRGSDKPN